MLAKFHTEVRPRNGAGKTTVIVVSHSREGVAERALDLGWPGHPADAFVVVTQVEELVPDSGAVPRGDV
jgi:hypothetical protein